MEWNRLGKRSRRPSYDWMETGFQKILMTAETDERILSEANRRNLRVLRKPLKPINLRAALM